MGVGMQTVAVVVNRDQSLKCGTNIIETHLLCMQRTARSLDMVFQSLTAGIRTITLPHGNCPDPPRDAPHHSVLGVHAIGEKERQVRGKIIDLHTAGQIGFHVGKTVRQGECELGNRISTCLGNVIAGD